MKPITLHPLSVLAGAMITCALVLATGAQTPVVVRPSPDVRVLGIPDPAKLIEVREENSFFNVPAGKRFVMVWSWVQGNNGSGSAGSATASIQLFDGNNALFLTTSGTEWSGRVFLDGPNTFRVQDINGASHYAARLVGCLVDT